MTAALLIAILLVAAAVLFVLYLWLPIRAALVVTDILQRTAVPYVQHQTSPRAYIAVAGDSTAFGLGALDNTDSIAGRIGQLFPNAEIENIGEVGLKLAMLKEKLRLLKDRHYGLMVLQIGANDITGRTSYVDIRRVLAEVLGLADTMSSRVIVMTAGNVGLSPVFRWPLAAYMTRRTLVVRGIFIAEVAKHANFSYVDLFKSADDEPFNKDIPRYYAADRFHPSAEGYGLWFEKLRKHLPLALY